MQRDISELFNRVRTKAKRSGIPYSDGNLNELLGLINPGKYETFDLGVCRPEGLIFRYLYSEPNGEAILTVKSTGTRGTDYTIMHVGIKSDGELDKFIGLYGTAMSRMEDRFRGKLGEVKREGDKSVEYIMRGLMKDFIDARDDSFQGN